MIEPTGPGCGLTTDDVVAFSAALRTLVNGVGGSRGAELVDQIRALEELKSATAAAQARATARFAAAQRAWQRAAGVPIRDLGKGVAAQIALARRDSPVKGSRHLGLAEALLHEMPHTFAALEDGEISEWRATLLVRETACLSTEDRGRVDAELAARPGGLAAMGDRTTAAEASRICGRLDPHAVTARARTAESARRVTLRPAPDTMSLLTGVLPARQGVAAYAALTRHADSVRAMGDARTRGQIMADTLVERVTGQPAAQAVPVEVNLVMTDTTLLGDGPEPAELEGYGPLPAPLVRNWLRADPATVRATADRAPQPATSPSLAARRCGCAGCTPTPTAVLWWRWTRCGAGSTATCAGSSSSATGSVAPPGAMRRSDTSTTWWGWRSRARLPRRTAKDCARPATTPRRSQVGPPGWVPTGRSRRSRRRVTAT